MNREAVIRVQPTPVPGKLVVKDQLQRHFSNIPSDVMGDCVYKMEAGEKKYGSPLMTENGRSAGLDAYQDLIDTINYSIQEYLEEDDIDEKSWMRRNIADLVGIARKMRGRLQWKGVLERE